MLRCRLDGGAVCSDFWAKSADSLVWPRSSDLSSTAHRFSCDSTVCSRSISLLRVPIFSKKRMNRCGGGCVLTPRLRGTQSAGGVRTPPVRAYPKQHASDQRTVVLQRRDGESEHVEQKSAFRCGFPKKILLTRASSWRTRRTGSGQTDSTLFTLLVSSVACARVAS